MLLLLFLSHLAGELFALLARLVSMEGSEAELADEIRDRTLSFMEVEWSRTSLAEMSSASRSEPSVSHSIGVEVEEPLDTVLAMESFLRWLDSTPPPIRRRKRDSLLALELALGWLGSIRQERSNASRSSITDTASNHLANRASRSIV